MKKDDKQLQRELEKLGFRLVRKSKHVVMLHPEAGLITIPSSSGGGRSLQNNLTLARRLIRMAEVRDAA